MKIKFLLFLLHIFIFAYSDNNYLLLKHIEPGGIGYKYGYTTAEFYRTFYETPKGYGLGDIRVHVFDNAKVALNVGLGGRKIFEFCNIGLNAYYDLRQESFLFQQFGAGLDVQIGDIFFKINGYLPLGGSSRSKIEDKIEFPPDYFMEEQLVTNSFYHFDFDLGFLFSQIKKVRFYFEAGGYYLKEKMRSTPVTWGAQGLIRIFLQKWFILEGSISYDRLFQTQCQGRITWVFPSFMQGDEVFFPPMRQEIIPLYHRTMWEWNY
jgi:hypothetical protein